MAKHKASSSMAKYFRRGVLAGSVWKVFKNREIIPTQVEMERNEPK